VAGFSFATVFTQRFDLEVGERGDAAQGVAGP
jgi:hypothetical protein